MKTIQRILIIHPEDPTTEFLSEIYEDLGIQNEVLICRHTNKKMLPLIEKFDVTIFIGHGNEAGLFSPETHDLLVDSSMYNIIKSEKNILLWCNSDSFLVKNNSSGLCINSLITDMNELSNHFNPREEDLRSYQKQLNHSNFVLVFILKSIIEIIISSENVTYSNINLLGLINKYYCNNNNQIIRHNRDKIKMVTSII